MPDQEESRIHGLGDLIQMASNAGSAPVDQWNPPYCGDIGLKIDVRGGWWYQGSEIRRLPLVKVFARVLRCEADGSHFLVTPVEKVDVAVADAPFLAVEMQVDGAGADQRLTFRTNLDDIVVAGPKHPILFREEAESGGLKPYVRVRGRLYARLTRALYVDLIDMAMTDSVKAAAPVNDRLAVISDGATFPVCNSTDADFFD